MLVTQVVDQSFLTCMASQTLILGNPTFLPPFRLKHKFASPFSASSPNRISIPNFSKPHSLSLSHTKLISFPNAKLSSNKNPKIYASSSIYSTTPPDPLTDLIKPPTPTQFQLTESTRPLTTLLSITFSLSKFLGQNFAKFNICQIPNQGICGTGSLFFAAISNRTARGLNTPLTVVAAGMCKWLEIYSMVLTIRCMLSWFPNIPWDKQPLSAIRDLCDPFLNLFRNIIPPLFDTVDISSLLAFAVLGCFAQILKTSAISTF